MIEDMNEAIVISEGIDAIVHLGGYAAEGPWETILQANVVGCYNMFEAARRNGVKRLVFASGNLALGFSKCDQKVITAFTRNLILATGSPRCSAKCWGASMLTNTVWRFF